MFPTDALTVSNEVQASKTASTTVLSVSPFSPVTILSTDLHQDNNSNNPDLMCGAQMINHAYGNSDFQVSSVVVCTSDVTSIGETNTGVYFYSMTYVPRVITSTSSPMQYIDTPNLDLFAGFALFYVVVYLLIKLFKKK